MREVAARFPDGELDYWPIVRSVLPGRAEIDSWNKRLCEEGRNDYLGKLATYATNKEYSFSITEPENVRKVQGSLHDIWAHSLTDEGTSVIQIPRHVIKERVEVGANVNFREVVPAFIILGSKAHEIAHGDRAQRDPDAYRRTFNGFRPDNRHELDLEKVRDEELATDLDAYRMLHALGMPFDVEDYIATIPQPAQYHDDFRSIASSG